MSMTAVSDGADVAPRRLTTVVAADICGYSRLAETSDEAAVKTVNIVRAAFERVVAQRRGRIFHSAGDGFLAEFPSAADGVLAALEFVADIKARNSLSPTSPGAQVRAGVHSGDVIEQPGGDLLGHGVNIAARLQGEAEPNGVLVSLAAVNLVRGSVEAHFSRRGPLALKNIDEPVVAFDAAGARTDLGPAQSLLRAILRIRRISPTALMLAAFGMILLLMTATILQRTINPENSHANAQINAAFERDISILSPGEKNYLDRQYLAKVLQTLTSSHNDSAGAVLTLLEADDTTAAIRILKERLQEPQLSTNEYVELNHQIGAIAELAAPAEAAAAYRRILAKQPDDAFALARLASAYLSQNRLKLSREYYEAALSKGFSDEKIKLLLQADLAFIFNLERRLPEAIASFTAIVDRASEIGFDELEANARASLGIALGQAERFSEAREQYLAVLLIQPEDSYLASKARSAWGIAHIARMEGNLPLAERFYDRALDYEVRANRAHGKSSVLFGMAMTDIAFAKKARVGADSESFSARLARAEKRLNESLSIARKDSLIFHINMGLVGLSQVFLLRGDYQTACEYIAQSAALLTEHEVALTSISPEVRAMASETGCPSHLDQKAIR